MISSFLSYLQSRNLFIILSLFPIAVLLRSATLNFYLIFFSIIFIIFYFKNNNIKFEAWHKIFFLFILYTSLLSWFATDQLGSLKNSISLLRFIFFALFIAMLKIDIFNLKRAYYFISFVITLVCLDVFYQYFTGYDILGFYPGEPGKDPHRLSGPFGKELIVGSYIFLTSIPIISFFFSEYKNSSKISKVYFVSFLILTFLTVLFSGERMSLILYVFSLTLIIFYYLNLKKTISFLLILFSLLISFFIFNKSVNYRISNFANEISRFQDSNHLKLFSSALSIWQSKPVTGVGLKNFRKECNSNKIDPITKKNYVCSTHPHNIYFEILAETGLIGFVMIITMFFLLILKVFKNIKFVPTKYRGFLVGSVIILISYIWPIKSSGSMFTTFYASFLWYNIGIIALILGNKSKINEDL